MNLLLYLLLSKSNILEIFDKRANDIMTIFAHFPHRLKPEASFDLTAQRSNDPESQSKRSNFFSFHI